MTQQEARHIVEATTRFEAWGGHVWLRDVRWLRAVERQRSEEEMSAVALAELADAARTVADHRPPSDTSCRQRRAVQVG